MKGKVVVVGGASPEQFVIYAQRLINLIFLSVNLHHEPLSFIMGERSDGEKQEKRDPGGWGVVWGFLGGRGCVWGWWMERHLNYLVLIKLLLPDADVRDRKDYSVAD